MQGIEANMRQKPAEKSDYTNHYLNPTVSRDDNLSKCEITTKERVTKGKRERHDSFGNPINETKNHRVRLHLSNNKTIIVENWKKYNQENREKGKQKVSEEKDILECAVF